MSRNELLLGPRNSQGKRKTLPSEIFSLNNSSWNEVTNISLEIWIECWSAVVISQLLKYSHLRFTYLSYKWMHIVLYPTDNPENCSKGCGFETRLKWKILAVSTTVTKWWQSQWLSWFGQLRKFCHVLLKNCIFMKIEYLRNANSGHNLKQFFLYCAFIKVEN